MRAFTSLLLVELLAFGLFVTPRPARAQSNGPTTPIQHLVVIFQENVSFDHYFGTYPFAANPSGEPQFNAAADTPTVNGLTNGLMARNPNMVNATNGTGSTNPFRLDRSQAATADQNHNYGPEQAAFHSGLMDLFPKNVGVAGAPPVAKLNETITGTTGLTMGYYDGNTITALWNYAQRFAMNDNSYDTNFGPSTPGALNLVSGQTNGVIGNVNGTGAIVSDNNGGFTAIGDADPVGDVCSTTTGEAYLLSGANVGDLLNTAGVSWGFFTQGFDLTVTNGNGTTGCGRTTTSAVTNTNKADYIPHHEPFQYYKSTANPTHARPISKTAIGTAADKAANHQYDVHDFYDAILAGNYPAVSFLKAPGYQDGHAGYSDPLDEQTFIVNVVNFLQQNADWEHTAVVIAYDDSDGWYDHQMSPIVNQSATAADELNGAGACGTGTTALPGVNAPNAQGRCGYGPRLPLLVISPWARQNFVDHTVTDQTSIIRFVEDNWLNGQRIANGSFDVIANSIANMFDFESKSKKKMLILDPNSGMVVKE
ncbi:MAG TPA: alkaline phosphatase family protein [Bryobacteraceae bacterium]|jgi:phospholipase C|nr:alkaline phosphatase family protein [Bryobacteraceae bacterium]